MTEAMRDYLERRLVKVRSRVRGLGHPGRDRGRDRPVVWVRKLLVDAAGRASGAARQQRAADPDGVPVQPLRELHRDQRPRGRGSHPQQQLCALAQAPLQRRRRRADDVARHDTLAATDIAGPGSGERASRSPQSWGRPFFFLYGRRDGTISYMGANIYPIDVEYGLYRDEELRREDQEALPRAGQVYTTLESRPVVHVQLRKGAAHGASSRRPNGFVFSLVDYLRLAEREGTSRSR